MHRCKTLFIMKYANCEVTNLYGVGRTLLLVSGVPCETSAVLRLECSIDCISGSVGHQQNIFCSFSHCQRLF